MHDDDGPICDCTCEHCMEGSCVCFGPNTIHRPAHLLVADYGGAFDGFCVSSDADPGL